jgi:hypothetical protein
MLYFQQNHLYLPTARVICEGISTYSDRENSSNIRTQDSMIENNKQSDHELTTVHTTIEC